MLDWVGSGREHRRHKNQKKIKIKIKSPKLVVFSDGDVILREAAVAPPAAHLSSFLETLDECHAVDLMKVLKAAL